MLSLVQHTFIMSKSTVRHLALSCPKKPLSLHPLCSPSPGAWPPLLSCSTARFRTAPRPPSSHSPSPCASVLLFLSQAPVCAAHKPRAGLHPVLLAAILPPHAAALIFLLQVPISHLRLGDCPPPPCPALTWYLTASCVLLTSPVQDCTAFSVSGGTPPSALSASRLPSTSGPSSSSSSVGSGSSSPSGTSGRQISQRPCFFRWEYLKFEREMSGHSSAVAEGIRSMLSV